MVDYGQIMVNLGHHLENLPNTPPLSTLDKPKQILNVKTLAKGDKPLDVNMSFWNFVHVLQILSKHSKFYQYESCVKL
jgi:hypothetical protein